MNTVYLDTETTGLDADDEIVEITIIDDDENILIDTLVKPVNHTEWPSAEQVHGISPMDVRNAPTQIEISDQIRNMVRDCRVVIYNAPYDRQYLSELEESTEIKCCMREFAEFNGSRWMSLANAAEMVGYGEGDYHRALQDTLACRAVWKAIQY